MNGKLLAYLVLAVSAGLVVLSWITSDSLQEFASAALLQFGSALVVIPVVLWVERTITTRVEEVRAEIAEVVESARQINSQTRQESLVPLLARVSDEAHKTEVVVKVPGEQVWFAIATTQQWQFGDRFNPIHIYFSDPEKSESANFETLIFWRAGESLGEALLKARAVISQHEERKAAANFEAEDVVALVRAKAEEIVG